MKKLLGVTILTLSLLIGCGGDETTTPGDNGSSSSAVVVPDDAVAIYTSGLAEGLDIGMYGASGQPELTDENKIVSFKFTTGQSAWFFPGTEYKSDYIDASKATKLKISYAATGAVTIRIMWGAPPSDQAGKCFAVGGVPYWVTPAEVGTCNSYLEGGFLLVELDATKDAKNVSIDIDDMTNSVNDYFVDEKGLAPQTVDLSKIHQIVVIAEDATVQFSNIYFE